MEQEAKSRLALSLTNCQLAVQGSRTYPCGGHEALYLCLRRFSDREHHIYVEFLTHIDSICLFVQNQQFERYTESMLNRLAEGAAYAEQHLSSIGLATGELTKEVSSVRNSAEEAVDRLKQSKEYQLQIMDIARQHNQESRERFVELDRKQSIALERTAAQLELSQHLMNIQKNVASQIAQNEVSFDMLFKKINKEAEALIASQRASQSTQEALASHLLSLEKESKGLRSVVETVAEYQRRYEAVLIRLLGKSYSYEDALYWLAGFLLVMICGTMKVTQRARLPISVLFATAFILEKLVETKLYMWLDINTDGHVILNIPYLGFLPSLSDGIEVDFKWGIRKLAFVSGLSIMGYSSLSYRDKVQRQLDVLKEIVERQEVMRQEIRDAYLKLLAQTRIETLTHKTIQPWPSQPQQKKEQRNVTQHEQEVQTPPMGSNTKRFNAQSCIIPAVPSADDVVANEEGQVGLACHSSHISPEQDNVGLLPSDTHCGHKQSCKLKSKDVKLGEASHNATRTRRLESTTAFPSSIAPYQDDDKSATAPSAGHRTQKNSTPTISVCKPTRNRSCRKRTASSSGMEHENGERMHEPLRVSRRRHV